MTIRSQALSEVGGYRESFRLAQDYDLWLRMAETFGPGWLHVVPEVLYERTIEAAQLQKRHQQRVYGNAARECARARRDGHDDEQILHELPERVARTDSPDYTQRELEGMYHYLLGTKLLEQNRPSAARRYLLTALWFAPKRPRPWYRLVLSILPRTKRQSVQHWVKTQL